MNTEQITKINSAYNIGKNVMAKDGMTFGYSMTGILGAETTWGIVLVGDKYTKNGKLKSLYDSSLGAFQIKLSTAKRVIMKEPKLSKYRNIVNTDESTYKQYEYHNKMVKRYLKILSSNVWMDRYYKGEPKAIKTIKWARKEYKKHNDMLNKYRKEAKKDIILINKLMMNTEFGALIGAYYMKMVYEEALRKFGKKQAYWKAIGRYNGGWNNKTYYNKVKKYMKISKRYIK